LRVPIVVNTFEVDGVLATSNIINVVSLPVISSYPSTITLIQSTNAMYLAGGHFNFALGSLPAASPAYQGHLVQSADQTSVQLTLTTGPVGIRSSVTWVGVDNQTATTNWSDRLNWALPGAPGAGDNVIFGDGSSTVSSEATVNNFVNSTFTIGTLAYNQITSGAWHVTQIPAGSTLTVTGAMVVGGATSTDGAKTAVGMMDAGTLVLKNSLTIGNNGNTAADSGTILDLSGLSNFVFNASSGSITLGNGARSGANLNLAGVSNNITASTINANIAAASSSANGTLNLGAGTNILNVGTFNVAEERNSCTVQFPASATTGGLRLRGTAGTDASRCSMILGNRTANGSSGGDTGTLSLNTHQVDMKFSTLTVGECTVATPNFGTGVLNFDTGIIDVSNLDMAVNSSSGTANGTITLGGANATLIVGAGGISLASQSSTGSATGNLTDNGGTIICYGNITKTNGAGSVTANVTLNGGTLSMMAGNIGTLAFPIDLTLNDGSTLGLNYVPGFTNNVNIIASGTTTINVNSFTGLGSAQVPVQVPLIRYTSSDPYSNLALGTVPGGYLVGNGGALVDDTANQTIDIIVTPPPAMGFTKVSGNTFQISWPANRLGWRLEVQTNAVGAGLNLTNTWYTVPGSTSVTSENITADPKAKGSVFYRLTYP
jgi:hypothetical protein